MKSIENINLKKFVINASKKHNDKYDYSLVEYINNKTKVKIICQKHGIFEQAPLKHINRGQGCPKCSGHQTNSEIFIEKAKEIHGDLYDYSLIKYVDSRTKVKIICPIHGIFEQLPTNHLKGKRCFKCSGTPKKTNYIFIKEAEIIHGKKYDYSLVAYINNHEKIKIICPIHGIFKQSPSAHLMSRGCQKCGYDSNSNKQKHTLEEFIRKSAKMHNDKYDYSLVKYFNSTIKVKILCPKHGIFEQTPHSHLAGYGCLDCQESKGEREIKKYLKEKNIEYISQHKFNDCKNIFPLSFDFYIPEHKLCIEYQGLQHYRPVKRFGGKVGFEKVILRDKIKVDYCEKHKINLLLIKYNENIIKKLDNIFL